MQILNLVLIITVIACPSLANFSPLTTIALPNGVIDMQFSADQKYLAILNSSVIAVYNGVTGAFLTNVNLSGGVPTSLSFSQSGSDVAVGFKNGAKNSVQVYTIKGDKNDEMSITMVQSQNKNDLTDVIDLCWLPDAKRIVYGNPNNNVFVFDVESKTTSIGFDISGTFISIACSPKLSNQFAVSKQTGDASIIQVLELTLVELTPIQSKFTHENSFPINSITYSRVSHNLYAAGKGDQVIGYQVQAKQLKVNLTIEAKGYQGFSKVRVIEDEIDNGVNTIVFSDPANVIIVRKNKNSTQAVEDDAQESYKSTTGQFALGPYGANFVYDVNKTNADFKGACKLGSFLNELTSTCKNCSLGCSVCYSVPTLCYKCQTSFFFDGTQSCVACSEGCLECKNQTHCTKCDEAYQENNGICQTSDDGTPTWLIVLLVIIGVVAVLVIAAFVVMRIKKNKKRSPLLTDSDDAEKASMQEGKV